MTYEEILKELNTQIEGAKIFGCDCKSCDNAKALRAVVELHKPEEDSNLCNACVEQGSTSIHPCSTIKAVQNFLRS